MPNKILVVDDDSNFREELRDYLDDYTMMEASSGEEALRLLKRANDIDVIILDVMMPKLNGIDVLNEIKKTDPDLGIIIMTGYSSKDVAIEALKAHADDFIEKPMQIAGLKESIDRLLESKQKNGGIEAGGINGKLEKVKLFVERNCFKKISLNDASQAVFLSPKYLSKIFKENTGVGFSEFKLKIKSEKARELLVKTCLNINQISDKLGYENPESFIRQFKRFAHCTPTEFRKKSKGLKPGSAKAKKTAKRSGKKKK